MTPAEIAAGLTEEKALEDALAEDADQIAYMAAFRAAQSALYQRTGDKISECDARCFAVLREHFAIRAHLENEHASA